MQRSVIVVAFCLIFFIFFAVVVTLQFRRENRKKPVPCDVGCETEGLSMTTLTPNGFNFNGQIAPTQVYQANTAFNIETNGDFANGGVLFAMQYPNENENGTIYGFALVDVASGNMNSVANVPCAVGWNMNGGPNSSTCKTSDDVEGWQVEVGAVKTWTEASNVTYIQTLTSPSEYRFTITWDPVVTADVYAIMLTLAGDSYNSSNVSTPTTLSFGGLTTKTSVKIATGGSNYFTADVPIVESVRVVGFYYCDLGDVETVCLGANV